MRSSYAYIHVRPSGEPFYVGKGTLQRALSLQPRHRNPHHGRVVAKYGVGNILIGVIECSDDPTAMALEVGIIKCLKRMGVRLTNQTDGGQGQRGRKQSEAEIAKKSAALRGRPRPPHVVEAIRRARLGKVCSPETRAKLSAINKAKPLHPEFLARCKEGRRGADNPHARAVVGTHPLFGSMLFSTCTAAAQHIGGSVSKVVKSARGGYRVRGWSFRYQE